MARVKYWIQRAVKRPGSLKAWLKKNAKKIKRRLGESPFTKDGKINTRVLHRLKQDKELLKDLAGSRWRSIHRKINLAVTLKRLGRDR